MSEQRLLALDSLRGIAILLVLMFHLSLSDKGDPILPGGFLGVDIFFVLSGFLITSILHREFCSSGTISLRRFYIRRILRLFPALIFLLLVCFAYAKFFADAEQAHKINQGIVAALFYYSNWIAAYQAVPFGMLTHTWSLAVEEQFYILWPLVLLTLLSSRISFKTLTGIVMLLVLMSAASKAYHFYSTGFFLRSYNGTDTRIDGLLIGSLSALLVSHTKISIPSLVTYSAFLLVSIGTMFLRHDSALYYYGGATLYSLCTSIVIAGAASNEVGTIKHLLNNRLLAGCGTLSYSIYLWHIPVHAMLWENGLQTLPIYASTLVYLLVTFIVASVSYVFIEKPFLTLKKRFESRFIYRTSGYIRGNHDEIPVLSR